MPKVSILIAVFNGEDVIRDSIQSLQQQTMRDIEIICVDDYSTDHSADIIRELISKDSRIKLISASENMGTVYSRKAGVQNASGEYLMFMDQDDRYEDFAVEELYHMIIEKNVDIVHFRSKVIAIPPTTERQRKWQEDFMIPYKGFLYGEDVFDGCFGREPGGKNTWYKYTWNLWNKIYKTDICKRAMVDCKDDYVINGDDMYVYMLISYYAKSYYGDANGKSYHIYSLGSGLMGNHKLNLRRFYTLVRRATGLENEQEFFKTLGDKYQEAYDIDVRRGLQGIVERWYGRLEPEFYGDGYDMMLSYIDSADITAAFEQHLHIGNVNLFNIVKDSASMQLKAKYTKQVCIYIGRNIDLDLAADAIKNWRASGYKIICVTENNYEIHSPFFENVAVYKLAPIPASPQFYEYPLRKRQHSLKNILKINHVDCYVYFSNIRYEYIYDLILVKSEGLKFVTYAADFKNFKAVRTQQKFYEYITTLECSDGIMLPEGCINESFHISKYSSEPDYSDIFALTPNTDSNGNNIDGLTAIIEDTDFKEACEKLAVKRMFRESGWKTRIKIIAKKMLRIVKINRDFHCDAYNSYYMLKKELPDIKT